MNAERCCHFLVPSVIGAVPLKTARGRAFLIFVACLVLAAPAGAIEYFKSTEDLVREAPIVAHVKVLSFRENPGIARTIDYTVLLMEAYKGSPPATFDIRIFANSRVLQPSPFPDPAGTEWFVILGNQNSLGFFPLRSLVQGKIRIVEDHDTGRKILSQPVTGFQVQGRTMFDLDRMRSEMKGRGLYGGRK